MRLTLQDRLFHRELGKQSPYTSIKGLYGDRRWINELDIVNELGGHTGCVNALSWSKSGRLLASGSDDQHLNIHSYQPDLSTVPFELTTTVATGHTANIFSVKFMPHSDDHTLVTCAGDGEVRVFDIEYSGHSTVPSAAANLASARRNRGPGTTYQGVRYLTDGNTNARVYRSHSDRAKRIVTESSPYLFLSCSEDGEVRQWDLRLPSSAYPPPRSRHDNSNVPPALISYKPYGLDLNTISCSATQPHYIVLGGTHLHCFLHDRRMLGRDLRVERGDPRSATPRSSFSEHEDDLMGEATRCVRRFAPNGQKKMRRTDNGHVTACKISDANPNEMIASWSGDHIYSFDLVRSPDAWDAAKPEEEIHATGTGNGRVKESKNRRGKRRHADSATSAEGMLRGSSQPRDFSDMALRIRYENGQSEEFSIEGPANNTLPTLTRERALESNRSDSQRRSLNIAKSVIKIRKLMLSLEQSARSGSEPTLSLTNHQATLSSALFEAAWCIPEMDEIIREWRYPALPTALDIVLQNTLRSDRDAARRFVQAAGTLARALGGKLRTAGGNSPALYYFDEVKPSPNEGSFDDTGQIFCCDFLKAILLWLNGGREALLQGFKRPPDQRNTNPRFPIPSNAQLSSIDDLLIPYLLGMGRDRPIPNVDASRFERDEHRVMFPSENTAVIAFSHAIRIPLEDLSRAVLPASSSADGADTSVARVAAQDKSAALRYWGFKVGRGLLLNAGEIAGKFSLLDRAFGGSGTSRAGEEDGGRIQEDIDPNDVDLAVHSVGFVNRLPAGEQDTVMEDAPDGDQNGTDGDTHIAAPDTPGTSSSRQDEALEEVRSESVILVDDLHNEIADHMADDSFDGDGDGGSDNEDADGEDNAESDGEITAEERHFMWQGASGRGKLRESVQAHVPCVPHTRIYSGHCNVKTVKDVNFFGLQDEYVVSGSDSGHLFIWDKETSQLLNILEGDGEVVNVAQGHPYEPLLAVSGIDHTIKIFSPDRVAQRDARHGINVSKHVTGTSGSSSIFGLYSPRPPQSQTPASANVESPDEDETDGDERENAEVDSDHVPPGGLRSRKRMRDSYRIISQNDIERQGGMRDSFITRSVLAQLATRLRARRAHGGDGGAEGDGEDGEVLTLDENCSVM